MKKKMIDDYYFYIGFSKQALDYETTVVFVINHIKKTFDQRIRVKRAWGLLEALGTPTVSDLKAIVRMNLIRNNKVTTQDINLASKVYGLAVGNI